MKELLNVTPYYGDYQNRMFYHRVLNISWHNYTFDKQNRNKIVSIRLICKL